MRSYRLDLEMADDDGATLLRVASTLHRRGAVIQHLQFDGTRFTSSVLARTSEPTLRESLRRIIGVVSVRVTIGGGQPGGGPRAQALLMRESDAP